MLVDNKDPHHNTPADFYALIIRKTILIVCKGFV